ncbi:hydrolase [Silicimonas sp. MF1-12-2]|uniref:hydrolase n=1 Tax=Silicimonas sp. MF1-12-2 TaxID=3384793 RepID=UPI0039B4A3AC
METNTLPRFDDSVNETGCCPRFNPEGWDGRELHFRDKRFLRAETRSAMHIPLNMGRVFARVNSRIEEAGGWDNDDMIVLSRDLSPFKAEHLFSVPRDIPGEEMTSLTGDFVTKAFEGPYRDAKDWCAEMEQLVRDKGSLPGRVYFFYTTCPKCAKHYGKNYVVGVAEI